MDPFFFCQQERRTQGAQEEATSSSQYSDCHQVRLATIQEDKERQGPKDEEMATEQEVRRCLMSFVVCVCGCFNKAPYSPDLVLPFPPFLGSEAGGKKALRKGRRFAVSGCSKRVCLFEVT